MNPLLEQFLNEARDNLSFLDKNLNKLEFNDPDEINALFRSAHTLKGGSGLVEFESVKEITHHAEDLLDALRKGKIAFEPEMLDALYDAFDEIVELIDATEESSLIPEFDSEKIDDVIAPIKVFLHQDDEEYEENKLDTELIIEKDNYVHIAELISPYNFSKFIKQIPLEHPKINQEFIEDDNYYLIDIDLDEQSVEFGNDPVYLISLLGFDEVIAINTYVATDCEEIITNPIQWHTRFTVIAKSNKELLEDSLYNIIDDIKLYPLSVESVLIPSYESDDHDILKDFKKEFLEIIENKNYEELNEKIIALAKILNPQSKECFTITRMGEVLSNFELGSEPYEHIINFVASELGIIEKKPLELETKEEEIDAIEEIVEDLQETKAVTPEEKTACEIILQQIRVLKKNNSKDSIKRIINHTTNVLDFIGIEPDFENIEDSQMLHERLQSYIEQIDETLHALHFKDEKVEENLQTTEDSEKVEEETAPKELEDELEEKEQVPPIKEIPEETPQKVSKEEKQKETPKKAPTKDEIPTQAASIPKTVKIDQADIDVMMDIVGEILVMKNALPYLANNLQVENLEQSKREILNKYEEISRITGQLQDRVMGMRLLPLSYIFNRYPKLVRDISKRLMKKIRFEEEGGDTKLDKTMIEQLADPLVHVIRNSLDHGIEECEQDRIDAGKDPVGSIKVSASSKGDKVYVVVKDDGRGINLEKVISKALENNLASVEEIEAMSESEKYMLIFHPGLSTKDQISDLSGRGVGTDAVKKTVEELGGKLLLESEKGLGTTLTMELPVSVALTKIFHVTMNKINYGISMEQIIETIKIKKEQIERANRKPFVKVRGELIPLVFESHLLPMDQEEQDIHNVVVLQGKSSQFGLVVNEFVNQLDVVQKPLEGVLANHPMVSGTSLLGNGDIIFIIDATKIIDDN